MGRSFTHAFVRDDGKTEIEVEYEVPYQGHSGNNWDDPGEGPEIEVGEAWLLIRQPDGSHKNGPEVDLTDEERWRIEGEIAEHPDWWEDDGVDPDYWRE